MTLGETEVLNPLQVINFLVTGRLGLLYQLN